MRPVNSKPEGTTIFDSAYDNIWLDPEFTKEATSAWGIVKFDETAFDGDDKTASLAVSDHRPLWTEFRVEGDDD